MRSYRHVNRRSAPCSAAVTFIDFIANLAAVVCCKTLEMAIEILLVLAASGFVDSCLRREYRDRRRAMSRTQRRFNADVKLEPARLVRE